jgi:hypothetical protein
MLFLVILIAGRKKDNNFDIEKLGIIYNIDAIVCIFTTFPWQYVAAKVNSNGIFQFCNDKVCPQQPREKNLN